MISSRVATPTARRVGSLLAGLLVGTALAAGCGSSTKVADSGSRSSESSTDSSSTVLLAPAGPTDNGDTVNGIKCETSEQLAYHIHAHLSVYVDGQQRTIPPDIGIFNNQCIYWLHTHDTSGIIHVESPDERVYTLGDFFAVWRQPLSAGQVGPAKGKVTAWVDGKKVDGDPAKIKIEYHTTIQLNVGTDTPAPEDYHFPEGV